VGNNDLCPLSTAPFRAQTAAKQTDGTRTTSSISVGKDGGRLA